MIQNNAWLVIANANEPTAAGVVAIFYGTNAEANAIAWRDENKPGFGVVPCNVPVVNLIDSLAL